MAKPRVFVSSTYLDQHHIRNSLERFIKDIGYEPVLFEKGDIAFQHDAPTDESCYDEIHACHMLVMIIGGRYGSPTSDTVQPKKGEDAVAPRDWDYNSITKREYQEARERDIPIFIFVQRDVLSEYETFKENREREQTKWVHVDSVKVFHLLDEILAQPRNNFVRPFENFDDIASWLRDQWAGLFSGFLSKSRAAKSFNDLASQLSEMRSVVSVLKTYSESIMQKVEVDDLAKVIEVQAKKLHEAQIERLASEDFIQSITAVYDDGDVPSMKTLYEAFRDSNSPEDFVDKSGLRKKGEGRISLSFGPAGRLAWKMLKVKYD